jgi:hypothetical protein
MKINGKISTHSFDWAQCRKNTLHCPLKVDNRTWSIQEERNCKEKEFDN